MEHPEALSTAQINVCHEIRQIIEYGGTANLATHFENVEGRELGSIFA